MSKKIKEEEPRYRKTKKGAKTVRHVNQKIEAERRKIRFWAESGMSKSLVKKTIGKLKKEIKELKLKLAEMEAEEHGKKKISKKNGSISKKIKRQRRVR